MPLSNAVQCLCKVLDRLGKSASVGTVPLPVWPKLKPPPCQPLCRCLECSRTLASVLLPYVRSIQAYSRDPHLLSLQPARWSRLWQGQLYDSTAGSAGQGASGPIEGGSSPGSLAGGEGWQPEDAIEDSGEDDW